MNQKQRTKLELIRVEGIWRMLLKKISDEKQLTNWIDHVTNTSTYTDSKLKHITNPRATSDALESL